MHEELVQPAADVKEMIEQALSLRFQCRARLEHETIAIKPGPFWDFGWRRGELRVSDAADDKLIFNMRLYTDRPLPNHDPDHSHVLGSAPLVRLEEPGGTPPGGRKRWRVVRVSCTFGKEEFSMPGPPVVPEQLRLHGSVADRPGC